jgi:hypothetical protein
MTVLFKLSNITKSYGERQVLNAKALEIRALRDTWRDRRVTWINSGSRDSINNMPSFTPCPITSIFNPYFSRLGSRG